jgi:hypothetical protein
MVVEPVLAEQALEGDDKSIAVWRRDLGFAGLTLSARPPPLCWSVRPIKQKEER